MVAGARGRVSSMTNEQVAGHVAAENDNLPSTVAPAAMPAAMPSAPAPAGASATLDRRGFLGLCAAAGASCALALAGCGGTGEASSEGASDSSAAGATADAVPILDDSASGTASVTATVASTGDPAAASASDEVEALLSTLTLEQKIYQLFIIRPEALTGFDPVVQAGDATRAALEATPVGGLAYFAKNITGADQFTTMLANTAAMAPNVPLFLAIDEEGGPLVARVANSGVFDVPAFPAMYEVGASGDATAAFEVGDAIGSYLSQIGINLDFAPVADVLTNMSSSIGDRSFSSDPQVAAAMVAQAVAGLQGHGVSATVKHFPGLGDVEQDSHTGAAVSWRTLDDLRSCEFLPFKAAIDAGVDLVMVGHVTTPAASGDELPATLSPTAITGWLRTELGFDGVVVSDSMAMGAVTESFTADEAAAAFIIAGGDVVLDPEDFPLAYAGVLEAVRSGRVTEARVDESVRRILRVKLS